MPSSGQLLLRIKTCFENLLDLKKCMILMLVPFEELNICIILALAQFNFLDNFQTVLF